MYSVIDLETWKGRKHYLWFKQYTQHYYSITAQVDVDKVVHYAKENKLSFFIVFLYLINLACNSVEEMRLRVVDEKIRLYDVISPAYIVLTNDGRYDNCEHEFAFSFKEYYSRAKKAIEKTKLGVDEQASYNDYSRYDQYYFTCLPWIDFTGFIHPMSNDVTQYTPRLCWGKYHLVNDKYMMALNVSVSHALVDGKPLSQVFINLEELINRIDDVLK